MNYSCQCLGHLPFVIKGILTSYCGFLWTVLIDVTQNSSGLKYRTVEILKSNKLWSKVLLSSQIFGTLQAAEIVRESHKGTFFLRICLMPGNFHANLSPK